DELLAIGAHLSRRSARTHDAQAVLREPPEMSATAQTAPPAPCSNASALPPTAAAESASARGSDAPAAEVGQSRPPPKNACTCSTGSHFRPLKKGHQDAIPP